MEYFFKTTFRSSSLKLFVFLPQGMYLVETELSWSVNEPKRLSDTLNLYKNNLKVACFLLKFQSAASAGKKTWGPAVSFIPCYRKMAKYHMKPGGYPQLYEK